MHSESWLDCKLPPAVHRDKAEFTTSRAADKPSKLIDRIADHTPLSKINLI